MRLSSQPVAVGAFLLALVLGSVVWDASAALAVPGQPTRTTESSGGGSGQPLAVCQAGVEGWAPGDAVTVSPVGIDGPTVSGCAVRTGSATFHISDPGRSLVLLLAMYAPSSQTADPTFVFVRKNGNRLQFNVGGSLCWVGEGAINFAEPFTFTWSIGTATTATTGVVEQNGMTSGCDGTGMHAPTMAGWSMKLGAKSPSWGSDWDGQGLGGTVVLNALGGGGVETEAAEPPPEPPDCGVLPTVFCEGIGGIAGGLGAVVDAVVSLGDRIVDALTGLAALIWEVFKQAILDPEAVSEAIAEQVVNMRDTGLGSWAESVVEFLDGMVPTVDNSGFGATCIADSGVCIGDQLNEMPDPVQAFVQVGFWAFIFECYLLQVRSIIRSVRH